MNKDESTPDPRINLFHAWPEGYRAMSDLQRVIDQSDLEPALAELVKMRASQLNGCAYCVDMHSKDARALGETEQRLYALSAWAETPFFTARERAALALTEAVTLVADTRVPDQVLAEARSELGDAEIAKLVLAIVAINGWNRMAITARLPVGGYRSRETNGT